MAVGKSPAGIFITRDISDCIAVRLRGVGHYASSA
jgi:hypothetical protein